MPTFGQVSAPKSLADGRSISAYNPEEKHRAYLQRLQERNQVQRQQQQDETTQEKLRREQGFNVCFSGANAAQRAASAGERLKQKAPRARSRGSLGAWRQWEEATVEIKGIGGEVYAIRPTGERVPSKIDFLGGESLPSWAETQKVPAGTEEDAAGEEEIPEELPEEDPAHSQADTQPQLELEQTQKELCSLGLELASEPAVPSDAEERQGDASSCRRPSHPSPAEGYRDLVAPEELAQRISSLPCNWQRALMDLLEKAEAEVHAASEPCGPESEEQAGGSTSFVAQEPATSSTKPTPEDNATPRSGGPEKNSQAEAAEVDREPLREPAPVTPPTQSKDLPTAAGGGTAAVRAVRAACASDLSTDAPDDE
eukprot:s3431_g3.t3